MDDKKSLADMMAELKKNAEELQKIDLDAVFDQPKPGRKSASSRKPKADYKPDWVKEYERKTRAGEFKHVLKTTDVVDEKTGEVVEVRVEKRDPSPLPPPPKYHEVKWDGRPTTQNVAIHGMPARLAQEYESKGEPLDLREVPEGPTKPVRKQMTALNKVWKYRNFRKCRNCGAFDTWESRLDPDGDVANTHTEVWCQSCGAQAHEVAANPPAHIGSWSPPSESASEVQEKNARRAYRWERAVFALRQGPKTVPQLCAWFRDVEQYPAVDFIMLDIQLRQMREKDLVVFADGKWWDKEDREFHLADNK